jgi:hypothetical protein
VDLVQSDNATEPCSAPVPRSIRVKVFARATASSSPSNSSASTFLHTVSYCVHGVL